MTPFETLVGAFPVFKVKNKTAVSKNIQLKDNEEVVVPAGATIKVSAAQLLGVPDSSCFKMISPTITDLISANVITSGNSAVEEDKSSDKKKK